MHWSFINSSHWLVCQTIDKCREQEYFYLPWCVPNLLPFLLTYPVMDWSFINSFYMLVCHTTDNCWKQEFFYFPWSGHWHENKSNLFPAVFRRQLLYNHYVELNCKIRDCFILFFVSHYPPPIQVVKIIINVL